MIKYLMLYFDKLSVLQRHYQYLMQTALLKDFFLVGGCVRDLLLGIKDEVSDIDFTMAENPFELYEKIEKSDFSHFITEKF